MGIGYLSFCSYWKNLTSPRTCWQRGTAFQFDAIKTYPQTQVVLTDLGTDVVLVTMAARIMQSVISLGKNLLQKRALYWRMLPRVWISQAVRAALWVCWSVLDLLLPMTAVYVYKNQSRFKTVCNSEQPMSTVTIECHFRGPTEPVENMFDEDLCKLKMGTVPEVAKMAVDYNAEKMTKMEDMLNKEVVLPSCTNPVILSMICMPTEYTDSSESEGSEVDSVDVLDADCSQDKMSTGSDKEGFWAEKSKGEEDRDEESDWSDEDDSWDEESNPCNEDEDLWASFSRSDDPYNPFSFAMPTKSPRTPEEPKKVAPVKNLKTCQMPSNMDSNKVVKKGKNKTKPVLSGYKSTHNCTPLKEEPNGDDQCTNKKVRFSPKVSVRTIITWNYAHRMARKGPWLQCVLDRGRFKDRIVKAEATIGLCLDPQHREKIRAMLQSNNQN